MGRSHFQQQMRHFSFFTQHLPIKARHFRRSIAFACFPMCRTRQRRLRTDNSATARPLLALLINMLAVQHDPAGLLNAGSRVIILTAGLTALMIAICFGAAGYWLEGAAAGVGGGLSMAYLTRTAIGRIDTDQLNLGFMYLLFGLLVFAGKARSRTWSFAFALRQEHARSCSCGGITNPN